MERTRRSDTRSAVHDPSAPKGLSLHTFSGPVGRTLSEEISPRGWLDPPIVIKKNVQPGGHADTPHAHLV